MRTLTVEEQAERVAFAAARDADLTNATARLVEDVEAALAEDDLEEALLNVARDAFVLVAPDAPPARRGAFVRAVKPAVAHTTPDSDPKLVAGWMANAALNYATLSKAQPGQVKEWVTMRDEHVRDGHRVMDKQTRVLKGRFKVMGHRLAYPGQPVGPPEVWLQCRCSLRLHAAMTAATAADEPLSPPAAVVVAVPADDDPIWDASSETIPHVTLIYLGPADDLPDPDGIAMALAAVSAAHGPTSVDVTERTTLGDDDADVLMVEPNGLAALRDALLADPVVAEAEGAVEQFPKWLPHLTLGYPEAPATGEPGQTIGMDKVALWMGDYEGDTYALGGGTMPEDEPVEEIEPLPADDEEYASGRPLTWHGVLAPEGVWSGDRRKFSEGALAWRDLPLPLSWQKVNAEGHGGSVVVGNITDITREGNLLRARGTWASTPEADEVIGLIAEGHVRGVSVDVDDVEMSFDEANEQMTVNSGRISGATVCAIPAFMEAHLRLGDQPSADDEFAERPEIGGYPIEDYASLKDAIQAVGRAKPEDRARTIKHIKAQKEALGCPDVELPTTEGWSLAASLEEFVPNGPADKRGPGWVTAPKATRRIHAYWTHPDQPGYAKIGWGAPGDFNRCRSQLAKYVDPLYLNRTCAEWHHDALGIWPGEHAADLTATQEVCEDCDGPALALVAAAPGTVPAAWFDDPGLTEPTPLTIEGDRIFGHLAVWGTCHVGISGACVTPPESPSNYAYFRTGGFRTAEGAVVPVGQITMDTGHAPLSYGGRPAAAHYDNTGTAVADVSAGDDGIGIWVAGALRPGVDPAPLLAAKLSGDWRDYGGALEMVAALAVNTPGFPVPRVGLAASAGHQTALVAAGMVPDATDSDFDSRVHEAVTASLRRRDRARETLAQARALRASVLNETVGV